MKNNTVGVVIVCYNTPGIISEAVNSIYKYVDEVFIVDNSDNDCYKECDKLSVKTDNVRVKHTNKNIGHGPGLNIGVSHLDTEYIICMDSDAVLIDPKVIKEMKQALRPGVYGSGKVLIVIDNIRYLWLPFCMFRKETFLEYSPFIHGGAPFLQAMKDIRGKMKIVQIPGFDKKVSHQGRATRKIAGDWRKSFGGRKGI
ncbi:MAG: glycosyltransferase family 2 protein [Bacteroidales bacterium]